MGVPTEWSLGALRCSLGRSTSDEDIDRDAETYVEQAMQILVAERTEVRRNSEWLAGLSFADVIRLVQHTNSMSTAPRGL